jgi:hypothetical protein
MYARVAMFEGDPGQTDRAVDEIRSRVEAGRETPPKGLEGLKEMWMLVDRKTGKRLGITLFETEEELRQADDVLNAMSPADTGVNRTGVTFYEVALHETRD